MPHLWRRMVARQRKNVKQTFPVSGEADLVLEATLADSLTREELGFGEDVESGEQDAEG